MIAGVALDRWKLDVFKRHLDNAGFAYTEHHGNNEAVVVLKVTCEFAADLLPVVQAAERECRANPV